MVETAQKYLADLTSLYTPTPSEFDAARSHRASIEVRLDLHHGLHEMFETGSLKHGTGVWRRSDADFIVSLKGERPDSPIRTLTRVKETLQARFPSTPIGVRQPAVVCSFSDGIVEVVPAFPASTGYWIADPLGGWMLTHPKAHNQYVNDVNKKHNGAAKMLARQTKIWKYLRNVPVSSCYLEMRSARHMEGESSYVPLWDLYLVLKKIYETNLAAMNDPTGLGSRFGSCSSESKRLDAMSKLATAVSRARSAKDFAEAGDHRSAIANLKLLFNQP
jgi:hypothetical protein